MKPVFLSVLCFALALVSACRDISEIKESNVNGAPPAEDLAHLTPKQLSTEDIERRDEVEAMMMRGEYLHDGPAELRRLGDIDSVPALLVVLKENPPYPNGTMICTRAHAIAALRELTGAYPGPTNEEWFQWWETYKRNNPVSGRLEKAVSINAKPN